MEEVSNIKGVKALAEADNCGNIMTEMVLPWPDHVHINQMDADIMYYFTGFIFKTLKKAVNCVAYGDVLGEISALERNIKYTIPEKLSVFLRMT